MENEIRRACVGDYEALVLLAEACEDAPQWSAATWQQVLQSAQGAAPLRAVLVIGGDQGIAGFGVIRIVADAAEIESLGVLASARRRGFGTVLCRALWQTAAEAGACQVQIEVRSRNAAALALYRQLGFMEEGRRKSYYHDPEDDAVLMSCSLEEQKPGAGTLAEGSTL